MVFFANFRRELPHAVQFNPSTTRLSDPLMLFAPARFFSSPGFFLRTLYVESSLDSGYVQTIGMKHLTGNSRFDTVRLLALTNSESFAINDALQHAKLARALLAPLCGTLNNKTELTLFAADRYVRPYSDAVRKIPLTAEEHRSAGIPLARKSCGNDGYD